MSEKVKLDINVHVKLESWNDFKPSFHVSNYSMESMGYTIVATMPIEFEMPPDSVIRAGTVKLYRAEQERIRAEMHSKIVKLDEEIQKLMALEYKPDLKVVA